MSRVNTCFDFRGPCALVTATSLALSSMGCATLPKTGVESTGEPLNVEIKTETHTYVSQAKVGEVVNRDSAGRVIGTSEVYENRVGSYDVTRWQAFQGGDEIDDQDLYRISGDIKTAKDIAAYRASGVLMNRIGLGFLIGGGVATGAGMALAATQTPDGEQRPTYTTVMMSAGIIALLVGGSLMFYGAAKTKRQHPIDDPERADKAARKYNAALGSGDAPPAAQEEEEEEEEEAPKPKKKRRN
jgi:hypothetical protein